MSKSIWSSTKDLATELPKMPWICGLMVLALALDVYGLGILGLVWIPVWVMAYHLGRTT